VQRPALRPTHWGRGASEKRTSRPSRAQPSCASPYRAEFETMPEIEIQPEDKYWVEPCHLGPNRSTRSLRLKRGGRSASGSVRHSRAKAAAAPQSGFGSGRQGSGALRPIVAKRAVERSCLRLAANFALRARLRASCSGGGGSRRFLERHRARRGSCLRGQPAHAMILPCFGSSTRAYRSRFGAIRSISPSLLPAVGSPSVRASFNASRSPVSTTVVPPPFFLRYRGGEKSSASTGSRA